MYVCYLYFDPGFFKNTNSWFYTCSQISTTCFASCDSFPAVIPQHLPKLSASLKERLKRTRRSFISPLSVAKRLCVDDVEEEGQQLSADSKKPVICPPLTAQSVDENRNEVRPAREGFSGPVPKPTHVHSEESVQQLRKEVKEKTETLRRLKMVQMYRCKVSSTFKLNRNRILNLWCESSYFMSLSLSFFPRMI